MNTIILEKHELVDMWPDTKNAYRCICLDKNNKQYETRIPKAEYELLILISFLKSKLNQDEIVKLSRTIEDYGDERYHEGYMNAQEDLSI